MSLLRIIRFIALELSVFRFKFPFPLRIWCVIAITRTKKVIFKFSMWFAVNTTFKNIMLEYCFHCPDDQKCGKCIGVDQSVLSYPRTKLLHSMKYYLQISSIFYFAYNCNYTLRREKEPKSCHSLKKNRGISYNVNVSV